MLKKIKNSNFLKTLITVGGVFIFFLIIEFSSGSYRTEEEEFINDFYPSYGYEYDNDYDFDYDYPEEVFEDPTVTVEDELTIGSTANFNGIEITLDKAYKYPGDRYNTLEPGMTYLVTEFTIRNNTSRIYDTFETDVTCYANDKAVYDTYLTDFHKIWDLGDLSPGKYGEGVEVFSVPEDATQFDILVTPEYSSHDIALFTFELS